MLIAAVDPAAPTYLVPFLQTVAATVFIVVLAIFGLRYLLPRLHGMRRNASSGIQVVDFQALSARHGVYILKIREKTVAVGVTENSVSKICDL